MENKIKISVIGAGRFGSFFGNKLSPFCDVMFFDKNIKECPGKVFGEIDECLSRDIIFLAVPVSELENFLIENSSKVSSHSVLVDLSSVKLKPKELIEKYLPEGNRYLLAHPLFGPDSAKHSMEGHKIVITELRIDPGSEALIRDIFKRHLKLEIIELSSDEHDRLMAFNLSLMHHLGRTFDKLGIREMTLRMRSLNEIALITEFVMNDSGQLFKDFYRFNPYSHLVRELFEETFKKITPLV